MEVGRAIDLIDDKMCWGRGTFSVHHMPEYDEYWQAGEMAIEALKERDKYRWIPVAESQPTETGLYLVTENAVVERKWTIRMRIAKCEISKLHDGRVDVCWRGYGGHVLAWRHLPELFQVEEE